MIKPMKKNIKSNVLRTNTDAIAVTPKIIVYALLIVAVVFIAFYATNTQQQFEVNWTTAQGVPSGYARVAARASPESNIDSFYFSVNGAIPTRVDTSLLAGYDYSFYDVAAPADGQYHDVTIYGQYASGKKTGTVSVRLWNIDGSLVGEYI